jgi:hypothetical protein
MHLRILPDLQKLFFKKDIFERQEWLKTCFVDAFAHTSRLPETFFLQKRYFRKKILLNVWSGSKRILMHLRILPEHQNHVLKKVIFERLEWLKTCFDAFSHTSDHQKNVLKKDIFDPLEWLKTCLDAFAHTSRQPETFFFQKRYFERLEWFKTCFDAFTHTPRPPETFFSKNIFLNVWSG